MLFHTGQDLRATIVRIAALAMTPDGGSTLNISHASRRLLTISRISARTILSPHHRPSHITATIPRIARGIATAAGLRPYQALHDRATTTLAARVRNKKRPDVGWMWVRDHEWEIQKKDRMIWRRKWLAIWAIAYAVFRDQRDEHQALIEKDFNMVGSKLLGKHWPWGGTTTGQAGQDLKAKDGAVTKDFPGQRGWFWKDTGLSGELLGWLMACTVIGLGVIRFRSQH